MMYDFTESVCSKENIMRTTINIQDDLMEALLAQTKAKMKTKAIELSVREHIEKNPLKILSLLAVKLTSIQIGRKWKRMS